MKRIIAFIMALVMTLAFFTGCFVAYEDRDRGERRERGERHEMGGEHERGGEHEERR